MSEHNDSTVSYGTASSSTLAGSMNSRSVDLRYITDSLGSGWTATSSVAESLFTFGVRSEPDEATGAQKALVASLLKQFLLGPLNGPWINLQAITHKEVSS